MDNQNLTSLDALSSDRVADMAHELRSPLGGIESMIALLGATNSSSDHEALIAGLKSAAAHLRTVANQLLKPDAAQATSAAIGEAIRFFSVSARARANAAGIAYRLDVATECETALIGDATGLRQMLENIVDNAIRHAKGDEVILRVRAAVGPGGQAMIECAVLDRGEGITASFSDQIFRRGRSFGAGSGAGLGLSIVERIATQAGGRCGAGPRADGRGACVWFTVPVVGTVRADKNTSAAAPRDIPVLVVDDDQMSCILMKTVLGHLGYAVQVATSPSEAMQILQTTEFATIFTDVTMPGMDGWSFIRWMRANGMRTPIIGVSGRVLPEDRQRSIDAGANCVLDKPVTIHDLRQALVQVGLRDPMLRQVAAA